MTAIMDVIEKHKAISILIIYFFIGFIYGTVAFITKPDLSFYLEGRSLVGITFFYLFYFVLPSVFMWPINVYFSLRGGGRMAPMAWGITIAIVSISIFIIFFWVKNKLKKNK